MPLLTSLTKPGLSQAFPPARTGGLPDAGRHISLPTAKAGAGKGGSKQTRVGTAAVRG